MLSINNSQRLITYVIFKHEFEFEQYLDIMGENKYRQALTRFRISAHNLNIEKGRHLNINREQRICNKCNMKVIENEYHFLLVCPFYTNIRKTYLKPYFCHWPNVHKFESLMKSTHTKTILNLSKYIYYAMCERG